MFWHFHNEGFKSHVKPNTQHLISSFACTWSIVYLLDADVIWCSTESIVLFLGEKWFQIADMYYYSKNRNYLRICRINLFIYIRQYDVECEYIWTLVVYHFQCNGKLISKQRGKFHSRKHLSFKFVLFFVLAMLKSYVYDTACSLHRHHHHHRTKCALYMYVCIMIGQPGIYIYKYCVFEIYLICALEFPFICVRNT